MTKLNLGCGSHYLKDYVNIDKFLVNFKVDRSFDCNNPLDYANDSIAEILAIHLFEHLNPKRAKVILRSWWQILEKKGKLIMEMPDLVKCCQKYLLYVETGDNEGIREMLRWIYGNQDHPGQYHFWGWHESYLKKLLEDVGFKNIKIMEPKDETRPKDLSFRIEAEKL